MRQKPAMKEPGKATAQKTGAWQGAREDAASTPPGTASTQVRLPGYFSVKEAAELLGLSMHTVYDHLENGRLAGAHIGGMLLVKAEAVAAFKHRAPGGVRTRIPMWHIAPETNQVSLITITVRLRPGQEEQLQHRLQQMRLTNAHCFPGTVARYVVRNQGDPDEITLMLLWRAAVLPPDEQRGKALAALADDFAELLDWEHATMKA